MEKSVSMGGGGGYCKTERTFRGGGGSLIQYKYNIEYILELVNVTLSLVK